MTVPRRTGWVRALALGLAAALLLSGCHRADEELPVENPSPSPTASLFEDAFANLTPDDEPVEEGEVPTVLPLTPDAGRAYIDETLFIGDSNTARYMMYADETGKAFTSLANNIGVVSMGAQAITSLKCEKFKGKSSMYTLPEAVAMLKPKRIIIGFGTNNLGGSSTNATNFINTYKKGLAAIAEAWPYADIIVNAIPPLDKQRDNTNLTMVQVDAYNEALIAMCEEEGYHFLNTAEVLRDETTGWAKKDYTLSDGVHLSKQAVTALFEYVRTHAYITEDRRPQPLGDIPTPDGVPLGLISQDPIALRGAKVPVEFVVEGHGTLRGETSQKVKKGGTCSTVTAVADEGWVFDHWVVSLGRADASNPKMTFTVPENADANGVILTAVFLPDEHEHVWVELKDERVPATCSTTGTARWECAICGQLGETTLEKLPHTWGDPYILTGKFKETDPLYKLLGKYVQQCKVCKTIEEAKDVPSPSPSPSPSPTPKPSPSPTPSASPSPSPTPKPSVSPKPSPTPGPKPSPTPEPTPAPTEAPKPTEPPKPTPDPAPTLAPIEPPKPTDEPIVA